jgi:hypothetical protein
MFFLLTVEKVSFDPSGDTEIGAVVLPKPFNHDLVTVVNETYESLYNLQSPDAVITRLILVTAFYSK